jgi:hypothetical protein
VSADSTDVGASTRIVKLVREATGRDVLIAALKLLDPLADRGERFSPLQPVKQFLVAFGVLTRRCPRDR